MAHLAGRRPSQLPQLGRRGGGWAILQGLLIAAVLLSALVGLLLALFWCSRLPRLAVGQCRSNFVRLDKVP